MASKSSGAAAGTPPGRAQRAVQSVEVGGRLLLALAGHPGPMSLKDLAAAAGLPASRAHPYLVSFGRLRLIEQDPGTGQYALGAAALAVGLACLQQLDAVQMAVPVAQALARDTGHAVALAVWGNFGPTVVRLFEARQPLHVAMRAGSVMSVLGTATGRAFAAVMPAERIAAVLDGPLGEPLGAPSPPPGAAGRRPRRAPPGRAETLREIAREFQRHGAARAVGRPIPGVNAFSAVAFDHEGEPAIVITALGHEDRFPSDWRSTEAQAVRRAAAAITERLGGRAPARPASGPTAESAPSS